MYIYLFVARGEPIAFIRHEIMAIFLIILDAMHSLMKYELSGIPDLHNYTRQNVLHFAFINSKVPLFYYSRI